MEKKQDIRVIKTKKTIRNTFVQLLVEKEMDNITVKELAQRAGLDRKTIYNYYTGINDILEEMENELAIGFETALADAQFNTPMNAMMAFNALTGYIKENEELFSLITKIDGRSRLVEKIIVYFKAKAQSIFDEIDVNPEKVNLAVEFITAGIIISYRYWFSSGRKQSIEDFTNDLISLVIGGTSMYFTEVE